MSRKKNMKIIIMKNLQKITCVLFGALLMLAFGSCKKEKQEIINPRVEAPNMPTTFQGRPVIVSGTTNLNSKNVTFKVWDSGAIDGDIITLNVNGVDVLSNYTLTGNKLSIPVTLGNSGYNYVILFAHNEGDYSPNTAALSIVDDTGAETNLVLSADLLTCGSQNLYVK